MRMGKRVGSAGKGQIGEDSGMLLSCLTVM